MRRDGGVGTEGHYPGKTDLCGEGEVVLSATDCGRCRHADTDRFWDITGWRGRPWMKRSGRAVWMWRFRIMLNRIMHRTCRPRTFWCCPLSGTILWQMLKDRERLKAVIDAGVPIYTKEMALRDLASISIDYESERVQTSNISNVPLRITELLDNGYVEKVNRKLRREMDESVKEYGYLCWKIALVETAMRERMDKKEQAIFERMFARGKSYRQVCKAYKKGTLHNKQVSQIKQRCQQAIANHLKNITSFRFTVNT